VLSDVDGSAVSRRPGVGLTGRPRGCRSDFPMLLPWAWEPPVANALVSAVPLPADQGAGSHNQAPIAA